MEIICNPKPKITVIIPCYNQGDYIAETINSVQKQTFTNWECIIIDDESTDNSKKIITNFCKQDSRIKYIFHKKSGVSTTRNYAIANAQGEFILPLDADDLIAPQYIEDALREFEKTPDLKLCYCRARKFGEINETWLLPRYEYENLKWKNCIFVSCIFRKKDFMSTIGYNPNMKYGLEDWDFLLSFLKPTDKVYCINKILFFYRTKKISRSSYANNHMEACFQQIYLNHKELYEPYLSNILYYFNSYKKFEQLYFNIINTKSYKICNFLSLILRAIKKLISLSFYKKSKWMYQ